MTAVRWMLMLLVRGYQRFISPLKPPTCRFYPSCSQYTLVALERHGAAWGTYLSIKRLLKCHPFNPGGIDYVPEEKPQVRIPLHLLQRVKKLED